MIKDGKDGKVIAKIPVAKSKIYAHKVWKCDCEIKDSEIIKANGLKSIHIKG